MKILHSPFSIPHSASRGFTIIELMVTISIYVIISAFTIANYRDYSTRAVSANIPDGMVTALREAQVYGAGGRGCTATNFDCRYGVVFTAKQSFEKQFTVFTDNNDNKTYDPAPSGTDVAIETITWTDSSIITKVECLNIFGADMGCSNGILTLTFKRPNPDAFINDTADMTGQTSGGYARGRISVSNGLTGTLAKTRVITISHAGQISLQ
ncbi:MAG: prepilin-type N-terminal cleavage/methylation domain-containing protein [Candidatus Yonathbacteria bacterium]|nr:prepilin-type N-terminal cleavage/methylation domain-containing protein [Candidatus Yonathbacteria bacterium]